MLLVEVAVLDEPVADHRMVEQVPVGPCRGGIGIARDQHDGLPHRRQDGVRELAQPVGLDVHHAAARQGGRELHQEGQGHLGAARVLDIALEVDHQVGTLADRLGMDVVEGQVRRAMAADAAQLVQAGQRLGTAAARGEPAAPGRDADPALGGVENIHQ